MAGYRSRVKEKLQRKLHESDRGSTAELHAALALLPTDATQVELLGDRLLWVEPERFATVRDLLEPHRTDLTEKYWRLATAPDQDPDQRFHAACALATFDSRHDHWQDMDFRRFVAEHLVGVRPSVLAVWRAALRPVKQYLVDPLSAIYRDPSRGEQLRSFATDSLSEFAAQDPDTLFELLAESEQDQFSVMYERLMEHREPAIRLATAELARTVADSWTEEEKDAFARRQANAAAALFKLGAPDALWPLLAHRPDPRVRSYIVHWLSRLGGKPLTLWKRFEQEADPTIRRALLLCLGGFEPSQLSPADRESIIPRLLEIYRDEPDAGLHGAAEWLLRVWGQATRLADIDRETEVGRTSAWRKPEPAAAVVHQHARPDICHPGGGRVPDGGARLGIGSAARGDSAPSPSWAAFCHLKQRGDQGAIPAIPSGDGCGGPGRQPLFGSRDDDGRFAATGNDLV